MNIRTPLIRAAFAATLLAGIWLVPRLSPADATRHATQSADCSQVHATLLPEVTVFANLAASTTGAVRMDATAAMPTTRLPTVHVRARWSDFAATLLRTHHRIAAIETAQRPRVGASE